nr:uncharacterized protein LOC128704500 [Cherax quadricarinatus]
MKLYCGGLVGMVWSWALLMGHLLPAYSIPMGITTGYPTGETLPAYQSTTTTTIAEYTECIEDDYGTVLKAGSTERCKKVVQIDPSGCHLDDPITTFILVDTDADPGSVTHQPHQVVSDSEAELYLQETQAGSYDIYCYDGRNYTTNTQYRVNVGYEPEDLRDWRCASFNWETLVCRWLVTDNPVKTVTFPYLATSATPRECHCEVPTCPEVPTYVDGAPKYTDGVPMYTEAPMYLNEAATYSNGVPTYTDGTPIYPKAPTYPDDIYTYPEASTYPAAPAYPETSTYPDAPAYPNGAPTCFLTCCTWTQDSGYEPTYPNLSMVFLRRNALVPNDLTFYHHADYLGATGQCQGPKCETVVQLDHWWTQYTLRVRLRSGAATMTLMDDGWWSDWSPLSVLTPTSLPEVAPAVGPGTFLVTFRSPLRDLTFTWRPVPTLLHNAPDFTYFVSASVSTTRVTVTNATVKGTCFTFANLSSSQSYRLEVVGQNSEGIGHERSWVLVWAARDMPQVPILPVVIIHQLQEQQLLYELRWSSSGAGHGYTVYLCSGHLGTSHTCQAAIYWLALGELTSVNLTLADFNLTDADGGSGVIFGVSVEVVESGASSGMSWDICTTPRVYSTALTPPTVDTPVVMSEGKVRMPWALDCDAWAGVVLALEVTYCPGHYTFPWECQGEVQVESEVWLGEVEVRHLEPDTLYTVWLRVTYRAGTSQWSPAQYFTTDNSPVKVVWWMVVVMVVVGLSSVVILVTLIRCAVRNLSVTMDDIHRDIHIPEGLISYNTPNSVTDGRNSVGETLADVSTLSEPSSRHQ